MFVVKQELKNFAKPFALTLIWKSEHLFLIERKSNVLRLQWRVEYHLIEASTTHGPPHDMNKILQLKQPWQKLAFSVSKDVGMWPAKKTFGCCCPCSVLSCADLIKSYDEPVSEAV